MKDPFKLPNQEEIFINFISNLGWKETSMGNYEKKINEKEKFILEVINSIESFNVTYEKNMAYKRIRERLFIAEYACASRNPYYSFLLNPKML